MMKQFMHVGVPTDKIMEGAVCYDMSPKPNATIEWE